MTPAQNAPARCGSFHATAAAHVLNCTIACQIRRTLQRSFRVEAGGQRMSCERMMISKDAERVPGAVQGLVPERKVFEVHIEQGHKYGAKVVLRGEAGMSELGVQVRLTPTPSLIRQPAWSASSSMAVLMLYWKLIDQYTANDGK